MKRTAVKTVLMSIVIISFYSQVLSTEKDRCQGCASMVKPTLGQFIKYALFGSTKLFFAHKLWTVAKEGYDNFKKNGHMYKEIRQASEKINKYASVKAENIEPKNLNQKNNGPVAVIISNKKLEKTSKELEEVLARTPDLLKKDYLRNVVFWNNFVGSLLAFIGVIDLYNCFKIARAMYNKEDIVRLEINFSIK